MKKIVTLGELLLRLSTNPGERLAQADNLSMHYGGAEANVSVSLANFGYDVYLISKVPENPLGKGAENHLRAKGVHTDYLIKGGERLSTYYLESGVGQRSAQVTYDRKHSSIAKLTAEEIDFEAAFANADLFHVSGITPALSQELRELTLHSLKLAKEKGIQTSFDFNYRSKLWSYEEAAQSFKRFLPYVDICFCGELDAVHFLGMEKLDDSMDKSERLKIYYKKIQTMYPNIKSMGSTFREMVSASTNELQGNLYADETLFQSENHHIDHIVDRVGGGDAFAAGILYGLMEGLDFQETIAFATAGSVLKHTIHGDCNAFSKEEIVAFAESESSKIIR